jgi:hypothetical protein
VKRPGNKPVPKNPAAKKPSAAKMASLTILTAAMAKAPSASTVAHKEVDKSPAVDVVLDLYVDMLNDAAINIDWPLLMDYGDYNDDMEEGLEGDEFGKDVDASGDERVTWKVYKRGIRWGGGQGEMEGDPDQELHRI